MKKYITSLNYVYFVAVIFLMTSIVISCTKKETVKADIINPYVISYNPVSGVDGVATTSNLVLTFDDIVFKGEGKITITSSIAQATQIIDINDAAVTISNVGRIVTINPPKDFYPGLDYTVVIDKGIVKDMAGNKYFGMPDNETWKFTTGGNAGDFTAPVLVSASPANNETNSAVTELKLKFDETVKTDEGDFIFLDKANGTELFRVNAKSTDVVVNKTDITILNHPLEFGKSYYVQVAEGVIKDASGNNFPGFTTSTGWNFSTTPGSGSDLIVHIPFNGNMADISGNKLNALKGVKSTTDAEFVTDAVRGQVVHFISGSYAQLPLHDLLRPKTTKSFSFNLWVKLAPIGSDPSLFSNKNWDGGGNPGFVLCTNDGNTYVPTVPGSGGGWKLNCANDAKTGRLDWSAADAKPISAPALSDDKWHMVTGVFNAATLKMSVYIDGKPYGDSGNASSYDLSKIAGSLYDATNDYPMTIFEDGTGQYNSSDTDRKLISGYMDELSVYGKALTDADVTALFAL